jgi:hypothetical protein
MWMASVVSFSLAALAIWRLSLPSFTAAAIANAVAVHLRWAT